jgi:hypothetical protein
MMHVCFLQSGPIDADAVAHQAALRALGATLDVFDIEPQMPLMLRDTARLRRTRSAYDAIVSCGRDAMRVADYSGIDRRVHLLNGSLHASDLGTLRKSVQSGARLVTSSAAVYRRIVREVADAFDVNLIRPVFQNVTLVPDVARTVVGAGTTTSVIYVPGSWHDRREHAMAMWAAGVLVFRDPAVRLLVDGGGNDGVIHRLVKSRGQTASVRVGRPDDWATHVAAADVALCAGDHAPSYAILNLLHRAGVPIVALRQLWIRERLAAQIPATLVEPRRPRFIARAMLEVLDHAPLRRARTVSGAIPDVDASAVSDAWRSVLGFHAPTFSNSRA